MTPVTEVLSAIEQGDPRAASRLLPLVYDELRKLAAVLPRRGLAALPEVVLDLVQHAAGRLLVAAAVGSPFALFAWPVPSPSAVRAGLRAFRAAWPASAPPPSGRPALAELDASARGCPSPRASRPAGGLLLAEVPSAGTAALLTQPAVAVAALLSARVEGLGEVDAASLVRRYLTAPARITRTAGELTVTLPPDAIDLAVRRAGLDRDPGWVPWLRRAVRLVFGCQEQGAGS